MWRRFKPGDDDHILLRHACLYCRLGDMAWDSGCREWHCQQCGWREYENVSYKRLRERSE